MQIGRYQLRAIEAGLMKLDGGAMFGSVPKALWEREHPADADNRILLSCRMLHATDGERSILVDTGMGDKWSEKERGIYGMAEDYRPLPEALAEAGVSPSSITDLILTHLHFDHAGGATRLNEKGETVPAFPQATHWVQKANLDNARHPNPREKASYRAENFEPLTAVDLRLVDGPAEILPGVRVHVSDGHTRGMQLVEFFDEDSGESMLYCADLVPTASHVHPAFTMGYDINAGLLIEEKAELVGSRVEQGGLLFFEHDPRGACGRLVAESGRHKIEQFLEI